MRASPNIVYVDVRPLQDPDYRFRGVGQHSTSLLTALRQWDWGASRPKMVALADPMREPLYAEHARFFDEVRAGSWKNAESNSWFLTLSPMTHDPLPVSAFLLDPTVFKIALFYDFIQLKFPNRYLHVTEWRTTFMNAFAWLEFYDAFATISQDSANDLIKYRNVDPSKVYVSGVAVRRSLEPPEGESPLPRSEREHILVAGGGDPRKNPECALIAHARTPECRGVPLHVFGNYPPAHKEALRNTFAEAGGDNLLLFFPQHLDDEELRQLYRHAIMTIVPSRAEGFSIPIIESAAAGTPVTVSAVGAHPELIGDPDLQFGPDDFDKLSQIMTRIVGDEGEWSSRLEAVAPLWKSYTTENVGSRFMEGVLARQPNAEAIEAPAISRNLRPRLAIVTPLPPSQSGVADYSKATLQPLAKYADLHIFTDSPGVEPTPAYSSLAPVAMAPYSPKTFDQRLSVLGNSHFHTSAFRYLLEHGGAALAHDARMIDFYFHELGLNRTLQVASAEAGRPVPAADLVHWLKHQRDLPVLFLSEIAKAAEPLLVHSAVGAKGIETLYGVQPKVLPFAQYRPMSLEAITSQERRKRREKLGWTDKEFVITSFGFVSPDKAPELLIWATNFLRTWGVEARLVLCGLIGEDIEAGLHNLREELGLEDAVTLFSGRASEETYMDHLIATDAAIQLRTYFMGGLSGALNDCIAAAVPTVANEHLAESSLAPPFVRRVSDDLSPLLIAEAFLDILRSGEHLSRPMEQARAFAVDHSLERYAVRMMESLGFDVAKNA
ncbi:glycosyltransferase [Sphingomonas trueperi]|uniref:glycosyltransferase n=1 Tax=Sphingomonas trueperi TaxID=53317 RepID=UPI000F0D5B4D